MMKRYDELKKGDKIWFHEYKAFIRYVKEVGTVTDKRNVFHFGEKIIHLNIGFIRHLFLQCYKMEKRRFYVFCT